GIAASLRALASGLGGPAYILGGFAAQLGWRGLAVAAAKMAALGSIGHGPTLAENARTNGELLSPRGSGGEPASRPDAGDARPARAFAERAACLRPWDSPRSRRPVAPRGRAPRLAFRFRRSSAAGSGPAACAGRARSRSRWSCQPACAPPCTSGPP